MTKVEKAFKQADKMADSYVENNKHILSKLYCMSSDQISRVKAAYKEAFMLGVRFK